MSSQAFEFNPTPALLAGRTVIVTGANTGLGYETAILLAKLEPARLVLAVRDVAKGDRAAGEIAAKGGLARNKVEVWELDLASTDSVKAFASRAAASLDRLDVLVQNAGVGYMSGWHTAPDGTEEMLKVNGLSTGLLGVLLLPLLSKTAALPLADGQKPFKPHITFVGSSMEAWFTWTEPAPGTALLAGLNDPASANAQGRYQFSKLVSLFLGRQMACLLLAKDVVVNVVCPGLCLSDLLRHLDEAARKDLQAKSLPTVEGAKNIAWAATEDLGATPGAYVQELKLSRPSDFARSAAGLDLERRLWAEFVALWKTEAGEAVDAALATR